MWIDQIICLIDILVWPVTIFLLILLARRPIQRLIPFIQRIRYKDFELEFSKKLAEVAADVGESSLLESEGSEERDKIYALVDVSPASAVIEAWKSLEQAAQEKVRQLAPKDETFQDPLRRPLDYLDHKGVLVPSAASATRDLRMLRNQAAHAGAGEISREDALKYAALASRIRTQIEAITELPTVMLAALTQLILGLNHLIDSRKYDDITIDEVYGWIETKSILPSLKTRAMGDIDLSLFGKEGPYSHFASFYHDQMERLAGGYAGDHGRKWGVENLGLCLLLAWSNELIQLGSGWYPNEM